MTLIPGRRKLKPSGIERAPRRDWPKHEQWVRGHECCAGAPDECEGRMEFAHIRLGGNAGTALKPPSSQGISLCSFHHRRSHDWGQRTFDAHYGIDSMKLASEFAIKSTDRQMIDAMRESHK